MVYLGLGEYEDGTLGEIWFDVAKAGSAMRAMMDAFARTFSIALQHGVPLNVLVAANEGIGFLPDGVVQSEGSVVQVCTSILDWAMSELGSIYLSPLSRTPQDRAGEDGTPSDDISIDS